MKAWAAYFTLMLVSLLILITTLLSQGDGPTWNERANRTCTDRGGIQQIYKPRVVCRDGLVYWP